MLKLSASSIGCYTKCPKQYHYRYIEKPDVEAKDWSFLEFGKCAHETLEIFHKVLMNNILKFFQIYKILKVISFFINKIKSFKSF